MRLTLFALVSLCALGLSLAEEEAAGAPLQKVLPQDEAQEVDHPAVDIDVPEEELDLARMLGDFFDESDDDTEIDRDARADQGIIVDDQDIVRKYNKFADVFYTRLGSALSKNDPMTVLLRSSKNVKTKKGKNKSRKKAGKRSKKKPGKRHPKDLEAEVPEEEVELTDLEEDEEEEVLDREERSIAVDEGDDDEIDDDDETDLEDDEDDDTSVARQGKALEEDETDGKSMAKDQVEGRRRRRKGGRRRGRCRRGRKGRRCRRRRRKAARRRKASRAKRDAASARALVSGVSSIRRVGDVRVVENQKLQNIHTEFELGPVLLRTSKKLGTGSTAETRSSQAMSPKVRGKAVITVFRNGKAKVSYFKVARPEIVTVTGDVRKGSMKKSLNKLAPVISRRMKYVASGLLEAINQKQTAVNSAKKTN